MHVPVFFRASGHRSDQTRGNFPRSIRIVGQYLVRSGLHVNGIVRIGHALHVPFQTDERYEHAGEQGQYVPQNQLVVYIVVQIGYRLSYRNAVQAGG